MIIIFWSIIIGLFIRTGWKITLSILAVLYVLAFLIRHREFEKAKNIGSTDLSKVKEGDVIVVCRGGKAGIASDFAELYIYHVLGLILSGSIIGHVGLVFRDDDGILKVVDVRLNQEAADSSQHFICTVPEFCHEYKGVKYLQTSKPLNPAESDRLTKAVKVIAPNTGHCQDCFNPMRIINTPSKDATRKEMLEFGKRYGYGCAENIAMILRWAKLDAPENRFIMPHHFAK